jgi:hypothetical protein
MEAAQVQRFPGQQVFAGRQRVGAEFFQRHVARHLSLRPGRGLAVSHPALEAGVGAQQFDIEGVGEVRLKGLHGQPVDQQPALGLQRRQGQAAVEVHLAGLEAAGGQAQRGGQRHGLGRLRPGSGPVVEQQPAQAGLGRSHLESDRLGAGLVGEGHGAAFELHVVDGHGPGRCAFAGGGIGGRRWRGRLCGHAGGGHPALVHPALVAVAVDLRLGFGQLQSGGLEGLAGHVDVDLRQVDALDRHQRDLALGQLHVAHRDLRRGDLQYLRLVAAGRLPVHAQLGVKLAVQRRQQQVADVFGGHAQRPGLQVGRELGGLVGGRAFEGQQRRAGGGLR